MIIYESADQLPLRTTSRTSVMGSHDQSVQASQNTRGTLRYITKAGKFTRPWTLLFSGMQTL